jgi:lipoyl(octanoyl) transferase
VTLHSPGQVVGYPILALRGERRDTHRYLRDLEDVMILAARGIALFETGRGGDVTLHSPGQVVGYPVLALRGERRDTHRYLRELEEVMILAARDFGAETARIEGLTGIWAGREKLGAIGVRLNSGWVTSHGFAFNAANDLTLFDVIVPCGIRGRGVTSLSRLLGRRVAPEEAMDRLETRFREVFAWLDGEPAGPAAERASGAGR